MSYIASIAPTSQSTNTHETFFQYQLTAPTVIDFPERNTSLFENSSRSLLNQRMVLGTHSIALEGRQNLAVPPSKQQTQMVQTLMDRQVREMMRIFNSSSLSPDLYRTIRPIFREVALNFTRAQRAGTLQEICNFLKKADEAISHNIHSLLELLRPPLVAEFENLSVTIFTYVEKAVLDDSENLDLDSRKNKLITALRTFLSQPDPSQNSNRGGTGDAIQEFRHKFDERKYHLRAAESAIQTAPTHEEIDTHLVNLINKIKQLNYPLSPQRLLVEREIFSIPEDLFQLRRQLGEQIFRP